MIKKTNYFISALDLKSALYYLEAEEVKNRQENKTKVYTNEASKIAPFYFAQQYAVCCNEDHLKCIITAFNLLPVIILFALPERIVHA